MAFTLTDNEFFSGLTNLALFMRLYATNNSSEPNSFVESFMTDTLTTGNKKIFPYSTLPSVGNYSETSSLLSVSKVTTGEEVIGISGKKVIKSSYSTYILDQAFTSESGMNNFIGYVLGQMESAKIDFLYDVIINDLFTKVISDTQLVDVGQYDATTATSFTELNNCNLINSKNVVKELQLVINNISVFNVAYNALGNKQALDLGDMRLIINEPYKTQQVVDLFATMLNSEYINSNFKKPTMLTIPSIKVPVNSDDVIGWLMHKNAYQMFYKFSFMGSFFDTSNLVINNFLHFWYGKGWLSNLPVVKFQTDTLTLA